MKAVILNGNQELIQRVVALFLSKAKYARIGHYWWVLGSLLGRSDVLVVGVLDYDEKLKAAFAFVPEGKDEAVCSLVYSEGELKEAMETIRPLMRSLGIRRVYTYVWGDQERGKAAERLTGGKIVATMLEMEV